MRGGVLFVALGLEACIMPAAWDGPVDRKYHPEVLIRYEVVGDGPPGQLDYLVRDAKGPAIYEQTASGAGRLLDVHWRDFAGDHYATPGGRFAPAWEVLVPADPSRPAYRFVYDVGTYSIKARDGIARPVPTILTEASAELRPAGRTFREPPPEAPSAQKGHQR
jgi:hypothetical protein